MHCFREGFPHVGYFKKKTADLLQETDKFYYINKVVKTVKLP
jgi:hypothetical protein